ncbi:hypothetical protein [Psychrobacillus phage Perkons]|nr:hypothetical protein [Psychrobacillus phage Perkons]
MKTIHTQLIYNIAVLITTVFLVHYLGWFGLVGLIAINTSYSDEK